MESMSLIVRDLISSYGTFCIRKVNFQLDSGDIMGLVGRSGSGKSTLLKTIIGNKQAVSGSIELRCDKKPARLSDAIGYSPQENSLYPYLSLEENIMTFARLYKIDKVSAHRRMDFLLKRLDLSGCRKKRIKELSGGMQKRADLAVTLIHNPKVIVLDEPFTGLDISLQRFIWSLLRELTQQGRIIIISSHMLSDVQNYCNKYGLIEDCVFYNHEQITLALKGANTGLEQYLEKLFTRDLNKEG